MAPRASSAPLASVLIDRPPPDVFDYMADFRNAPDYNEPVVAAELAGQEPIGTGTTFRVQMKMMGMRFPLTTRILEFDRPNRFVYENEVSAPITPSGELSFEQTDRGTRVTITGGFNPQGMLSILEPLFHKMAAREWKKALGRVKEELDDHTAS